ncbi:hypothetical protein QE379_002916 [Sphingomonas sp. SORGH_AS 879]|nr:hypothetical protein [Sphingomonas sp. SORGH_AS_0879]
MNRMIKEATVKRFHHDSHDQLRTHLADFIAAYASPLAEDAQRPHAPRAHRKIWTSEPDRYLVNPIHQMPGLNT